MFDDIDLLIVGAGPVGCVIAERAANELGWTSVLVEKRNHIAGNCYDRYHESGILVHQYGPHYFRTNSDSLMAYLSRFTDWIPGNFIVQSCTMGQYFPFPINLDTLAQFFNTPPLTADAAEALLASKREHFPEPKNSEEFVLSRVGRELYEAFYKNYTLKQWELHPRDLAPSVCGRIPVRLNRDNRYVDHKYQVTPANGFTALFTKMIDNPKIRVMLQTDYQDIRGNAKPRVATIYCGPVDEYFDHKLGRLPWRSLSFDFKTFDTEQWQPCASVNYPNDFAYTRTFEPKHITGQRHHKTVVTFEYPQAEGDPYYPVPAPENAKRYQEYAALADTETRENRVHFAGRLARYTYINTDEAIEAALATFEQLRKKAHAHE